MTGPHREHFIVACKKEIDAMEDRGTWHAVLRKDVPKDTKIIPLAWIMKIKVLPNGSLDCYKARMCVRGDLQVSDGSSTYAPVVKWATTRNVLAFAIKHDLCSRQVDFLNAFVHVEK